MTDVQDEILSVFIDQNTSELTDTEVSDALRKKGIICNPAEVHRHVQSLSPGLFQLIIKPDRTVTIRVQPTIGICEDFRTTRCDTVGQSCNKLHACRHLLYCNKTLCKLPHKFNTSFNKNIVAKYGCENLNPKLLVRFLDLQKSSTQASTANVRVQGESSDSDRRVDVSFPSSKVNQQVNMENIRGRLTLRQYNIESTSDAEDNGYCRRGTILFKQIDDVEKLLSTPVLAHLGAELKFKRTKKSVDKTNFLLKISIANEQDKIEKLRLESYISTLVDEHLFDTTCDLSTDNEQIILIQCKDEIDFDQIRQRNLFRPKLSGKDVVLVRIYEWDSLDIYTNRSNESIPEETLKRMFDSVWNEIFAYSFPTPNHAEVEFINTKALKQWKSSIDLISQRFQLTITPLLDCWDEDSSDTGSESLTEPFARLLSTTIELREDWALVANHRRTFQVEYKEFIRQAFGGTVDIDEEKATYNGVLPSQLRGKTDADLFRDKTEEFMRKFEYEEFERLDEKQVKILRDNANKIAFSRMMNNKYMVLAKPQEMSELKRKLISPKNPPPPPPARLPIETDIFDINTPDRMSMFSIGLFEDRLVQYLRESFNVQLICKKPSEKTKASIRLEITGKKIDIANAREDLEKLFSSLRTKKFASTYENIWMKITDAVRMINHHLLRLEMICICVRNSATTLTVNYFETSNARFGTEQGQIEGMIRDRFRSTVIVLTEQSMSTKLTKDCHDIEENIRQRNDYQEQICFSREGNTIFLFGIPELIDKFRQQFEQLKHTNDLQPCQITLSEQQLKYLTHVAQTEMNRLEREYQSAGCDISLIRLRQNQFLAPVDLHAEIKEKLQAMAKIESKSFDINEPGFDLLISREPQRLTALVQSKCYLDKKIDSHTIHIPIPQARVVAASASASANTSSSVSIGQSTLTITIGNLIEQAVDAIVVSTAAGILCDRVTRAAGDQVTAEFMKLKSSSKFPKTISGGNLSCKKIIFIQWEPTSRQSVVIKTSLSAFVRTAFELAIADECQTIAFAAVGCGQFNCEPTMIAKIMLDEARNQLKGMKTKMHVSFVLLPEQKIVYEAFVNHLNAVESIDPSVKPNLPSKTKEESLTIPFDRKTTRITLTSKNVDQIRQCEEEIRLVARSYSKTSQIIEQGMLNWPQEEINKYYEYCLRQQVIPTFDFDRTTVTLQGSNDAVHDCDTEFRRRTVEISNKELIHALAQRANWSAELTPNSNQWEAYSRPVIGIIENAYSKKHHQVDFENNQGEKCQINFSKMEEKSPSTTRRVRRVPINAVLPATWEITDSLRVPLKPTSNEFKDVLAQFRETMIGQYSEVIKIERIQNERWYLQYAAHREEFRKRYSDPNEKKLFHGCATKFVDPIIQSWFDRSYAGDNVGTLYGRGVYFHAQARYSHNYAQKNNAGERTMFLASVLVGQTCKGDQNTKVCPTGYNTTTDGEYIYVVYHDAGAYAEYLITYK